MPRLFQRHAFASASSDYGRSVMRLRDDGVFSAFGASPSLGLARGSFGLLWRQVYWFRKAIRAPFFLSFPSRGDLGLGFCPVNLQIVSD